MSLLPNPLLPDGAYGVPSVIEDENDDFSEEEEERPEPWVADSGATFHILSEDEVAARGCTKVPLPSPMAFNAANGQTMAAHVAELPLLESKGHCMHADCRTNHVCYHFAICAYTKD